LLHIERCSEHSLPRSKHVLKPSPGGSMHNHFGGDPQRGKAITDCAAFGANFRSAGAPGERGTRMTKNSFFGGRVHGIRRLRQRKGAWSCEKGRKKARTLLGGACVWDFPPARNVMGLRGRKGYEYRGEKSFKKGSSEFLEVRISRR